MAAFLYRFGHCMFRRRGLVVIIWAVVLAGLGAGAATLSGPVSNSVSIPGTDRSGRWTYSLRGQGLTRIRPQPGWFLSPPKAPL